MNLCSNGTTSNLTTTAGGWSWNCEGIHGGATASCSAEQKHLLALTKAGDGTGTVATNTGTISWAGNSGNGDYSPGTVVTLSAIADVSSVFTGWSDASCSGTSTCQATMDASKSATAAFAYATARVAGTNYTSVGAASSELINGGTMQLHAMDVAESIQFNRAISFSVEGGYDALFASVNNVTTIHGSIVISAGTVALSDIVLM
jgi:hypothetical protein